MFSKYITWYRGASDFPLFPSWVCSATKHQEGGRDVPRDLQRLKLPYARWQKNRRVLNLTGMLLNVLSMTDKKLFSGTEIGSLPAKQDESIASVSLSQHAQEAKHNGHSRVGATRLKLRSGRLRKNPIS